jgi:tyrosinase
MFGHGGCFGDPGHCEVPAGPRDPFDLRPPHQLVPAVRILTITPALKAILAAGRREMTVTVVAHSADERRPDVLTYETVRLLTYAD